MPTNRKKNKISALEKSFSANLNKTKQIAKANTVINKEGLTVVTKDDPIREETHWKASVKKYEDQ